MQKYYFTYKLEDNFITETIMCNDKYDAYNTVLSHISEDTDLSECFEMYSDKTNKFLPVNTFLEDKNLK